MRYQFFPRSHGIAKECNAKSPKSFSNLCLYASVKILRSMSIASISMYKKA